MGFSSPKAIASAAPPPPVTTSSRDAAYVSAEERKKQRRRDGYANTLLSDGLKPSGPAPKKTLLGG